jgi:hypothetical protein
MKHVLLTAVVTLGLAVAAPALAADGSTTFGGATVAGGVATLVSDTSNAATTDDFSGVTLALPAGLTLAQVTQLSSEYNVTDDDCAAGSPRFAINYGVNKNVVVYLGPSPNFTGCDKNTWSSTGNLVGTSDKLRVDTSQIPGGSVDSNWASALALIGNEPILSISLIVDSSWSPAFADKEQTVLARNVKLNDKTFLVPEAPPTPAKVNPTTACKAELALVGRVAFNEHWAKDGTSNGMGKCVSAAAKARNLAAQHAQIMSAAKTCKARGLKGEALGRCIAATDRLAVTATEAQEKNVPKGKAKGRR